MSDFSKTKLQFHLPKGIIYLDGNSLGPLPKKAQDRIQHTLNYEWGEMLVTGWNKAGWMDQPNKVGDRIAKLIGATSKTVTVGDTLSIKVFRLLQVQQIIKRIGKFYSPTPAISLQIFTRRKV